MKTKSLLLVALAHLLVLGMLLTGLAACASSANLPIARGFGPDP